MFKYETHLHTSPVSECAVAGVEETLDYYKSIGYDGVFITNHFIDGNINPAVRNLPYKGLISYYCTDYEKAVEYGEKIGIKAFFGIEASFMGTDFLVYGLDKNWFLEHPEIEGMPKTEQLPYFMESGALVIQAHPFREAWYIDHIRLFPRSVHGIEVINACRTEFENKMAGLYAKEYNLLEFAGSDNHSASAQKHLAGIETDTPLMSELDFVERILKGNYKIFEIKEK